MCVHGGALGLGEREEYSETVLHGFGRVVVVVGIRGDAVLNNVDSKLVHEALA